MKDITVQPNISIRQAMKALDKTAEKCLLVTDNNKKLLGTLTDGDLRAAILKGTSIKQSIKDAIKFDFKKNRYKPAYQGTKSISKIIKHN